MTGQRKTTEVFLNEQGWQDASQRHLAGDASNRSYKRLRRPDDTTAILMDAPPTTGEDTRPFLHVARYLEALGLSPPEILAADVENGFLLLEDLGDALFARLMAADPNQQPSLYQAAVDVLLHLHQSPPLDLPVCDTDWLVDMTAPAFEFYAPDAGPEVFLNHLRAQTRTFDVMPRVVILRDYHAENLIWIPARTGTERVGLLDFQDALLGHPAYDLVSVLQDARRDVSTEIEETMIKHYLSNTRCDPVAFRTAYAVIGVQRNLRILGIFARLCLRDAKPHYLDFVPRVWGYLQRDLAHPALGDLASALAPLLPEPSPQFLAKLRRQCPTSPQQP